MAQRSSWRASDEDRDQIAERLRHATAEGRLHAHELEERLAAALRARTYGELDALVTDLPRDRVVRRQGSDATRWVRPTLALAVAIPVALVAVALVIAVVAFVLSGVFAVWIVWMAFGWWFFGRHRHHRHRHRRPVAPMPRRDWT